ncbi:MAG: hypothetical protein WAL56_07700 [Candidatus Sulfotelmatobacter sp.]
MALAAPIPVLQQPGNTTAQMTSEKPITLSCGPVTFADGSSLTSANKGNGTFLVYRQPAAGSPQVWDDTGKNWTVPSAAVTPQSLFWKQADLAWESILVAIGNNDSAGNPTFLTDTSTGYPTYFAQCFFTGVDATGTTKQGQSPQSSTFTVLASGAQNLAGVALEPQPPDPTTATQIRMFLKDASLVEQGQVVIVQDSSGFHVQLIAGGASVVVSNGGGITLTPAAGQPVQINGNLSVQGTVAVSGVLLQVP